MSPPPCKYHGITIDRTDTSTSVAEPNKNKLTAEEHQNAQTENYRPIAL